jgi:glycine/D-amino acid oxidase-like deaminating enzyme
MEKTNQTQDLIIIGGGIMGLFTAYYASQFVKKIMIIEKRTIGNKEASSFSFTRSIRNDYLDPVYARLAYESRNLWQELQQQTTEPYIFNCGCLNLAKESVTPNLDTTYAEQSYRNLRTINFKVKKFTQTQLQKQFPQFSADLGCLDIEAGFLYLPPITKLLLKMLKERNIQIKENCVISQIEESNNKIIITTNQQQFIAKKVVITAGRWANDVINKITTNTIEFPITKDRPQEAKYFYPDQDLIQQFLPEKFPVFAYLDVGIYGHPIFDRQKGAVKIGYYNPPDMQRKKNPKINSVNDFVQECLPVLRNVRSEPVTDADQCFYDLVADDNFIIGKLPDTENIVVGAGWRGTGYKFAPLIGKILMQLAIQNGTVYDIDRFTPERFKK